jgi:vancomycin resistance protein VanJ
VARASLIVAAWAYLAICILMAILLRTAPVSWWPIILVWYSPRWLLATPVLLLAPLALFLRRRSLIPVALAAIVVAWPFMGLNLPWRRLLPAKPSSFHLRVLTCNADADDLNPDALNAIMAQNQPDLILLQECSDKDRQALQFPAGYQVHRAGGGLCVASRYPIHPRGLLTNRELGLRGWVAGYDLDLPVGRIPLFDFHLPTPREGLNTFLFYRVEDFGVGVLEEVSAAQWHASDVASRWADVPGDARIIAGDFNLPSDHAAFRRYWSGLADAFAQVGVGYGFTKYTSWHGVRIDHVLTDSSWQCAACWVEPDVGSDHRPVVADLQWIGTNNQALGIGH